MTQLMKTLYLKVLKNSTQHCLVLLGNENKEMLKAELELISLVPDLVISEKLESHRIFIEVHFIAFIKRLSIEEIHGDKKYINRYLEYWDVLSKELKECR